MWQEYIVAFFNRVAKRPSLKLIVQEQRAPRKEKKRQLTMRRMSEAAAEKASE